MSTGIVDRTSPDTGKFVSNKGTPFEIRQLPNGLYMIFMVAGGKRPDICNSKFTGYNAAERELIKYLRKNDRLGYAIWPDKR